MRSHAKASSAGSNSGRGASHRGGLAAVLLAAVVAVCLLPASASATVAHPFAGSFCEPTGLGTAPCEPTLADPAGMAVDPATGDLLVIDFSTDFSEGGTLHRYKPNGEPDNFSALSGNVIDGHPGEADATPAGNILRSELFVNEVEVAVAPPGAANGTAGYIYVTNAYERVVAVFKPSGEYVTQIGAGYSCGVAVDPAGNVIVGDYSSGIRIFSPAAYAETESIPFSEPCQVAAGAKPLGSGGSEGFIFVSHWGGGTVKLDGEGNEKYVVSPAANIISVDPQSGHLFALAGSTVGEYDASGAVAATLFSSISAGGEATGASGGPHGEVFVAVSGLPQVKVFGPPVPLPSVRSDDAGEIGTETATLNGTVNANGKQLTECYFEYGVAQTTPCVPSAASIPADSNSHAVSADISGLGANTTYHFHLVAASAEGSTEGSDLTFTTAIAAPVVGEQSAEASASGAILSAKINPKGARSTYHVEYGTSAAYGQSTPESSPIGFGGDDSEHNVSVHVGGLAPGTTYHFRFIATSPAGTGEGVDASFATYSIPPSFGTCPNETLRSGAGGLLPDCRAYEQVSPVDKHGANATGKVGSIHASRAGDRIDFFTSGGLPTSGGSSRLAPFLASRGSSGWSTDGLLPMTEPGQAAEALGMGEDMSSTLLRATAPGGSGLISYLRDSATGDFHLAVTGGTAEALAAVSADPEHLIFESAFKLVSGVPSFSKVYDLDHGALSVASRIPAGAVTSCDDETGPACVFAPNGGVAGPYGWVEGPQGEGGARGSYITENTISRDGSKVFFTTLDTKQLYVREDGTRTTQISASQAAAPDPNGRKPAAFVAATPDGSKVFFLSCEKLTDDSTAFSTAENSCTKFSNQGQDLYSYDTGSGELNDLTVDSDAGDPKGAQVQGVLGTSADGSYVYFVANGVLAPGASPGECQGLSNESNIKECNLYVYHDGSIKLIDRLFDRDFGGWMGLVSYTVGYAQKESRVSADGSSVLFVSSKSLTGYDNVSPSEGCGAELGKVTPCREFFRYNAPSGELTCVSCDPSGAPPTAQAKLGSDPPGYSLVALMPSTFPTRNLSADGNQVFFDSPDALVSTDTNGVKDVYEWEAKGSGSCESASQNGGCLYLISSGTSPDISYFGDASADGSHAFFFSAQPLVPGDRDHLYDVYDATVGGGLASQHQLAPPTCTGVACQANPSPPPDKSLSSAVFSGPGNTKKPTAVRKCAKGKRKVRRGRKVRCQKAHKQHKRHNNRGGSK